jgi:hypothetical protein
MAASDLRSSRVIPETATAKRQMLQRGLSPIST